MKVYFTIICIFYEVISSKELIQQEETKESDGGDKNLFDIFDQTCRLFEFSFYSFIFFGGDQVNCLEVNLFYQWLGGGGSFQLKLRLFRKLEIDHLPLSNTQERELEF